MWREIIFILFYLQAAKSWDWSFPSKDSVAEYANNIINELKRGAEYTVNLTKRPEVQEATAYGWKAVSEGASALGSGLKKVAEYSIDFAKSTEVQNVVETGWKAASEGANAVDSVFKKAAKYGAESAGIPEAQPALELGLKTVAGAGVAVGVATAALPALGFTAAGVAEGTIAAGVQSYIGNVAAGSVFAALQSAGATGMSAAAKFLIGISGAYVADKLLPTEKDTKCREVLQIE